VCQRFGTSDDFLHRVTPDTQAAFASRKEKAITGDYPTLTDIRIAYGERFTEQWLTAQIADAALFAGARNLNKYQQQNLARLLSVEYHYLKVTELLVFFYRLKLGCYGRFYVNVDPMMITCALREFKRERNELIGIYEQQKREAAEAEDRKRNPPMSRDEWMELKTIIAMYNPDYTV
jgi:hypothetical protein